MHGYRNLIGVVILVAVAAACGFPDTEPDVTLTTREVQCARDYDDTLSISRDRMLWLKEDRSRDGIFEWTGGHWVSYQKVMDICQEREDWEEVAATLHLEEVVGDEVVPTTRLATTTSTAAVWLTVEERACAAQHDPLISDDMMLNLKEVGTVLYQGRDLVYEEVMENCRAEVVTPTVPADPGNTVSCSDFATWQDAQDWFDTYAPHYGDVALLDINNNGVACEKLLPEGVTVEEVAATVTTATTVTTGRPATGSLTGIAIEPENCEGYDRGFYDPHGTSWRNLGGVGYLTGEVLDSGDVDHVVALQEAWCSGVRVAEFGSDGFNHLASVSSVNRGKGGHDPHEWWNTDGKTTPRKVGDPGWCEYLALHVSVKQKWSASMDRAEYDFLAAHLSDCGTQTVAPATTRAATTTAATRVTTTTEATRPLPRTCGEAEDQGWSKAEFLRAWRAAGSPSRYDGDGDGDPCENL